MANKKKQKMSNVTFFVICLLVGGLVGLILGTVGPDLEFLNTMTGADIVVLLVSLVIWFFLGIIVHELGHLVCGWLSGYTFGFFKLGSLSWFTEDKEIKFKRSKNFAVGQCVMIPPDNEAEFKFLLYNLGGVIFNFLTTLALLLLWYALPSNHLFRIFAIAGVGMNLLLGITNIIPLRSQGNDGANIASALKSADGRRALYLTLYINGQLLKGKRLKEIDEEIISVYGKLSLENHLVGNALMFEIEYLLETGQAEKALAIAQKINTDNFPIIHGHLFKLFQLLIYVSYLPDFDKARAIYEDENFQDFLKMKLPSVSSVLPAYEFFVNNNYEKAEEMLMQVKNDVANIPNKGERLSLMEYLEQLEEKIAERKESQLQDMAC